jgi:hypothetical protein
MMSEQSTEITTVDNWKPRVLIIGGVLGAAVGVASAYLLIQRTEEGPPKMSVGEGVKLGVLVFGLLRSIANL